MRSLSLCLLLAATPAAANLDTLVLANELASVLGSEAFCKLTYDQAAIAAFMAEKAPADDMSFAATVSMGAQGHQYMLEQMTESTATAHCAAIEKTARHFGFIK